MRGSLEIVKVVTTARVRSSLTCILFGTNLAFNSGDLVSDSLAPSRLWDSRVETEIDFRYVETVLRRCEQSSQAIHQIYSVQHRNI
jgi:hypothetical protein